jgi:hypothetical protein
MAPGYSTKLRLVPMFPVSALPGTGVVVRI